MSINPDSPWARTWGTPATGVGSNTPLRIIRRRPGRSVTRMAPSGRNAMLHGWTSPLVTNNRIWCWMPVSRTIGPSGRGGDGQTIGGGAVAPPRPQAPCPRAGVADCWARIPAPIVKTRNAAETVAPIAYRIFMEVPPVRRNPISRCGPRSSKFREIGTESNFACEIALCP